MRVDDELCDIWQALAVGAAGRGGGPRAPGRGRGDSRGERARAAGRRGKAVQVDPIKPTLSASQTKPFETEI
jgi:hypothetical protein